MKKLLAVFLCAAVLTLTACDSKETSGGDNKGSNTTEKDFDKITESDVESKLNELDGSQNSEPAQSDTTAKPEEYVIAMTDEIKNADFASGLVQLNNEVFQQGGYITVDDFVKQYEDLYDITYWAPDSVVIKDQGAYEECKDYLVAYKDFKKINSTKETNLPGTYLLLTPKQGDGVNNRQIRVYIANVTSPDDKIAVSETIVICMSTTASTSKLSSPSRVPVWAPGGLSVDGGRLNQNSSFWEATEGLENTNQEYTFKSFCGLLEEMGYTKKDGSSLSNNDRGKYICFSNNNGISFLAEGEKNLFDAIPLYKYTISFDPNTDKLDVVCHAKRKKLTSNIQKSKPSRSRFRRHKNFTNGFALPIYKKSVTF